MTTLDFGFVAGFVLGIFFGLFVLKHFLGGRKKWLGEGK